MAGDIIDSSLLKGAGYSYYPRVEARDAATCPRMFKTDRRTKILSPNVSVADVEKKEEACVFWKPWHRIEAILMANFMFFFFFNFILQKTLWLLNIFGTSYP